MNRFISNEQASIALGILSLAESRRANDIKQGYATYFFDGPLDEPPSQYSPLERHAQRTLEAYLPC